MDRRSHKGNGYLFSSSALTAAQSGGELQNLGPGGIAAHKASHDPAGLGPMPLLVKGLNQGLQRRWAAAQLAGDGAGGPAAGLGAVVAAEPLQQAQGLGGNARGLGQGLQDSVIARTEHAVG